MSVTKVLLIVLLTGAVLLIGLLAVTQPVRAESYEVTNTNNSGPGSLRQAITDSNNHTGPDIITFAASTNGVPIVLSGASGDDSNTSGDLDILDGGDLTIQGNGPANTIIDGGGIDRVFHVCPWGGCTNAINFDSVTIQNGNFSYGGGINIYAGTVTVDSSMVIFNTADNGGGIMNEGTLIVQNDSIVAANTAYHGGGILNYVDTATVDGSMVSANTATNGGGIFNLATLTVQNGSIIGGTDLGNTAENEGGGIYNYDGGTTTLDSSTVRANTAGNYGGGIYNGTGTLNVQNGSIIGGAGAGNNADYNGGGIYNMAGFVTVDGSMVSANTATYGGGIFNVATLTVQNGSIIGGTDLGNTADNDGGGIYNFDGCTTTVDSSTVGSNTAGNFGGGIYNGTGTLTVQNSSTVSANMASSAGGGIYNYDVGTTTLDSSTVSANTASSVGGGIYNGALDVQNGSIVGGAGAGNHADYYGGGIYNMAGIVTVDGSIVSANTAGNFGGGIYNGTGTLTVQNSSTVSANMTSGDGGGIYNHDGGTTTLDSSTVSANTSDNNGGGIYNGAGMLNVHNNSVIGGAGAGNLAINDGGGIYNLYGGTTTIDSSTVSANTAGIYGGGITNRGTLIVQKGSSIGWVGEGNAAEIIGGGIYNGMDARLTMTDSRILDNTAKHGGGGVYNGSWMTLGCQVTSSCIVGNSASSIYNDVSHKEVIATGNWWGAPGGPNTPGADTYYGWVDVSGYLTAPAITCSPDLQVGKDNDTDGQGFVDYPFHWNLTVSNTGLYSATFGVSETILVDELPAIGLSYGTPVLSSFIDIAHSDNIQCSIVDNVLTCSALGGAVVLGPLTGSFEVTFAVTPGFPGTLVNPAGVCSVDPDGHVTEFNESDNNCPVNVVDVVERAIYLPLVLR